MHLHNVCYSIDFEVVVDKPQELFTADVHIVCVLSILQTAR